MGASHNARAPGRSECGDVYAWQGAPLHNSTEIEYGAARIEASSIWLAPRRSVEYTGFLILRFYDEELFREILERTAKLVMNGTIEHYCAVKRVQSFLRPLERSRGTFESWNVAQELLDQYLLKPQ